MAQQVPDWNEDTSHSFYIEPGIYTYVPRTSESSQPIINEEAVPSIESCTSPAYPHCGYPVRLQSTHIYSPSYLHYHPHQWYLRCAQSSVATPVPLQHTCVSQSNDYHVESRMSMGPACHQHQQHACAPSHVQYAAADDRFDEATNSGAREWYGRTKAEVQEDEWKGHDNYERQLKEEEKDDGGNEIRRQTKEVQAKAIEPKGKPTDQYWVQHKEGGFKAYPLGTIKNNFEGQWKVDANGWPYLVET